MGKIPKKSRFFLASVPYCYLLHPHGDGDVQITNQRILRCRTTPSPSMVEGLFEQLGNFQFMFFSMISTYLTFLSTFFLCRCVTINSDYVNSDQEFPPQPVSIQEILPLFHAGSFSFSLPYQIQILLCSFR